MLSDEQAEIADIYPKYIDLLIAVIKQARRDADGQMTYGNYGVAKYGKQDATLFLMWATDELADLFMSPSNMPRGKL